MKRWILLLIVVLSVLLASCKAATTTGPATTPGAGTPVAATPAAAAKKAPVEKIVPAKYDYLTVLANCVADRNTPFVVCSVNKQKGQSYVDSIISDNTAKGWELITVINDGPHYAFFFKRDK